MTNPVPVPVSTFPPAGSLTGSEIVPVIKGGITSRTTTQAIADLGGGGGGAVDSVNGQIGVVILNAGDIGAVSTDTVIDIEHGGTGQVTVEAALTALLPDQSGQEGKVLTTDGTDASWQDAPGAAITPNLAFLAASDGFSNSGSSFGTVLFHSDEGPFLFLYEDGIQLTTPAPSEIEFKVFGSLSQDTFATMYVSMWNKTFNSADAIFGESGGFTVWHWTSAPNPGFVTAGQYEIFFTF